MHKYREQSSTWNKFKNAMICYDFQNEYDTNKQIVYN